MTTHIDRLWPHPATVLDDDEVLATYAFPPARPWLRMNFIASIDGAVTVDGRSGGLGDEADHRVFGLLRRPADAILVAAGTVRTEGYGAMRLADGDVAWRIARGMPDHPLFALVTRSLDLDPHSPVFTDAPIRPVVYTVEDAPRPRRQALERVADVVVAGRSDIDPHVVRRDLTARGLRHVHSEGGPSLFGALLQAGVVDELCLTLAPTLVAGSAGRITHAEAPAPTGMALCSVLRAGDELLLRYVRRSATPH